MKSSLLFAEGQHTKLHQELDGPESKMCHTLVAPKNLLFRFSQVVVAGMGCCDVVHQYHAPPSCGPFSLSCMAPWAASGNLMSRGRASISTQC